MVSYSWAGLALRVDTDDVSPSLRLEAELTEDESTGRV